MVLKNLKVSLAIGFLICAAFPGINAKKDGAPPQACKDMKPSHGTDPVESVAPFEIVPEKDTISNAESVKVFLRVKSNLNESHPASEGFKGYLIIAYDATGVNIEPLGTFQDPTEQNVGKTIDCDYSTSGTRKVFSQAAVTHTNNGKKKTAEVTWTPPFGYIGPVIFKATFVQQSDTFWIQETSEHINIGPDDGTTQATDQQTTLSPTTVATETPSSLSASQTTPTIPTTPDVANITFASACNLALALALGLFLQQRF